MRLTRWTLGFDLYAVNFGIPAKYTMLRRGLTRGWVTRLPIMFTPILPTNSVGLGSSDPSSTIPFEVEKEFEDADSGILSSVTWNVVRDKRNDRYVTTGGSYQSAMVETADWAVLRNSLSGSLITAIFINS